MLGSGSTQSVQSLSESLCKKLGLWLPLFRPVGANRGAAMLADLSRTISCLAELDASARIQRERLWQFVSFPIKEMPQTYALAVDATKTAVGLRQSEPGTLATTQEIAA